MKCSKCGGDASNYYGLLGHLCPACETEPVSFGDFGKLLFYGFGVFVVVVLVIRFLSHVAAG